MTDSFSTQIQQYIQALRRGDYKFPPISDIEVQKTLESIGSIEVVEFGDSTQDEAAKAYQARKRALEKEEKSRLAQLAYLEENKDAIERSKKMRKVVRNSLNGPQADVDTLESLREQAKQAMLAARSRARGEIKYCCGAIRSESYTCPLAGKHGAGVDEVNTWR